MTKEEILDSWLERYNLRMANLDRGTTVIPHLLHEAMDEYAKQVAIDCCNYLKSHGVIWNANNASTPAEELYIKFFYQYNQ